jgi:ABC-2 type transport system permease protein
MRYLELIWHAFRLGTINELQYRANFLVQVLQSVLGLVTGLAGLAVVFTHTDSLHGWRSTELLVVLGVYFLIGGMVNVVIQPSLQRFMADVREGTLDFTLTKPEDAQLLVSIREVELWKFVDIAQGFVVIAVALSQLRMSLGAWQALTFVITLLAGVVIVYCVLLILATCSFWVIRVGNILVIFRSMYEAGRWPVGIYPMWLRGVLTFLVPIAFAITVPAEALVGRLSWYMPAVAVALAIGLFLVSRWFWSAGIRHYSGASA